MFDTRYNALKNVIIEMYDYVAIKSRETSHLNKISKEHGEYVRALGYISESAAYGDVELYMYRTLMKSGFPDILSDIVEKHHTAIQKELTLNGPKTDSQQ